jgi:hypothetical protein
MDSDDVEGWLVEEGIGYLDERGQFQYGNDPREFGSLDFDDVSGECEC